MSDLTLVLGWDALDYDLLHRWGLAGSFGESVREIETFDNPVLEKPHTREVWPSIITGEMPQEHGIWVKETDDEIEWNSPVIDRASSLAHGVVPHTIRHWIGRRLRERGAEVKHYGPGYYSERGLGTVFDDRRAISISIPNYRTERDRRFGLSSDRAGVWRVWLHRKQAADGSIHYEPGLPQAELEARLKSKLGRRLGIARSACQRQYDLVFVWLGYLDTIGHLDPCIDERGWQRRHYEYAAQLTRDIRRWLPDGDSVVSLSDHGLRDGGHTHSATIAGPEDVTEDVESVLDVKGVLNGVAGNQFDESAEIRDYFAEDAGTTTENADAGEVRARLEDLGYV